MRLAFFGAPGSGKATQARLLAARGGVVRISMRELLRERLGEGGVAAAEAEDGEGVAEVVRVLETRLRARDCKRGFILEDFPRNIPQAQALDGLLAMLDKPLQILILLKVDDATLVRRVTGRLLCAGCGARYNRQYFPPKKAGHCDACEGRLTAVQGGGQKAVEERIGLYHKESEALHAYYKAQQKLRTVVALDADDADTIYERVCEIVDLEVRPLKVTALETAAEGGQEGGTVIAGGKVMRVGGGKGGRG